MFRALVQHQPTTRGQFPVQQSDNCKITVRPAAVTNLSITTIPKTRGRKPRVFCVRHSLPRNHVAFFAVLVDIEPLPFDFRRDPQTDRAFYNRTDDHARETREDNRQRDRF